MINSKYRIPFDVKSTSHFLKNNPDHPMNKVKLFKKLSEIEHARQGT